MQSWWKWGAPVPARAWPQLHGGKSNGRMEQLGGAYSQPSNAARDLLASLGHPSL